MKRDKVLLHEQSHMWFGDLVTMRWWNDLWLKESFARRRCPSRTFSAISARWRMWEGRGPGIGRLLVGQLRPWALIGPELRAAADAWLAPRTDAPAPLRRVVLEHRDDLLRTLGRPFLLTGLPPFVHCGHPIGPALDSMGRRARVAAHQLGFRRNGGNDVRKLSMVLALAAAGALVTSGSVMALASASADDPAASLVEDYSYPGAAQVETTRGIKLIKGDGHIMLADCGADPNLPPENLILVQTSRLGSPDDTNFCFKATGAKGFLTMEVDDVYFIRGERDRTVAAKVEVQEATPVTETERVDPGEWQPIGVGQGRAAATLVELRFSFTN
jgi:hypothetical protein